MDPFALPEEMPTGTEELKALRDLAQEAFERLRGKSEAGESLTGDEVAELRAAVQAMKAVDAELAAATALDDEIADLLEQGSAPTDPEEDPEVDPEQDPEEDPEVDPEQDPEDKSVVAAAPKAPARQRTSFAGTGKGKKTVIPRGTTSTDGMGFKMYPAMIGFTDEPVSYRRIAESIDAVKKGHRPRGDVRVSGGYANMPLFALERDVPLIEDSHQLVQEIERVTDISLLRAPTFNDRGSLTAAGGWCAPSEQLYDFCEVPLASDLVALPEITINRGGVRWPIEPDLTGIFESFEFFFTEPELEALPPVVKECVEIPCPDEFEEIRLNAVGYCVEAGILQTQGWPELIDWFMRSITQEHFRALSRRTILDMVAGSTPVVIPTASQIAAGSSVLNSIELMAINLRLNKGYARSG